MKILERLIWLTAVAGAVFLPSASEPQLGLLLAGVSVLSLSLGAIAGPKPVLAAAAAVVLVTAATSIATRADRRDTALPECVGITEGGSVIDRACEETYGDQALRGLLPAALVLVAGLTTGLLQFTWKQGERAKGAASDG